jgi:hypothetical protein
MAKISAQMIDQAFNSPIPYLNTQTRSQHRDELRNKIAEYDARIEQLVNHSQLEGRARAKVPGIQASLKTQKDMMTPPAWAQKMNSGTKAFANTIDSMYSPQKAWDIAQEQVIDEDNDQAAQLQGLRNKLQQQADETSASQQALQSELMEMKANAFMTYDEYVGHRVAAFPNAPSGLKNSVVAFVNKANYNDRTKLLDLQNRALARSAAESRSKFEAIGSTQEQRRSVVTAGANGAVPPQYFPGPNGIGGKMIPGLTSAPQGVQYPAQVQGYALPAPYIAAPSPMSLTPMNYPSRKGIQSGKGWGFR